MTLLFKDRVKELVTTPPLTGAFALAGAAVGFQTFLAAIGNANTAYYTALDSAGNWEVGLGTYSSSGNTLARTTILTSSNSNAAVNFTGAVTVWADIPALMFTLPTRQIFSTPGAFTYNRPNGVLQLRTRGVAAGGGGSGSDAGTNDGGAGANGNSLTFNGVSAQGGRGATGAGSNFGGVGGTTTADGRFRIPGQSGGRVNAPYGGAPGGGFGSTGVVQSGVGVGYGVGGMGGNSVGGSLSGTGGGGGGEYYEDIINNPPATISGTIPAAASGGTAGTGGAAGGASTQGILIVDEYYK